MVDGTVKMGERAYWCPLSLRQHQSLQARAQPSYALPKAWSMTLIAEACYRVRWDNRSRKLHLSRRRRAWLS